MQLENYVFLREMQELPYFHVQGHRFQKDTLHSTPCSWNSSLLTLQLSCFHPRRFSTVSSIKWTNHCRKKNVVCMVVVCCHSYRASKQFETTMLQCFAPAFGCPFLICQTERVTKQNSAPTWQEGVRKCMELSRFQQVNLCWQWWLQISVHASIVVWIIRWKLTFDILSLFKETCARYRCHQVFTTIQCNTKQCSALQYNAMYYITLITFD